MFLSVSAPRTRGFCRGGVHHQHPWMDQRRSHPFCQRPEVDQDEDMTLEDFLTPLHLLSALTSLPTSAEERERCHKQHQLKRKESQDQQKEEEAEKKVSKKARFEFKLNVEGFQPSDLNVKLVDNSLVISGNHNDEDESGSLTRSFTKKITIPGNVLLDELDCNLNSKDNTMMISAPWKVELPPQVKEKVIQINLTGPRVGVEGSGSSEDNNKKSDPAADSSTGEQEKVGAETDPTKLVVDDAVVAGA